MMIYLRSATTRDLPAILQIIADARGFLRLSGSDQWQGAYPAETDIREDFAKRQGYVLMVGKEIAGYSAIMTREEPAYTAIKNGSWTNDSLDYVTVHRIALSDKYRGQQLTKFLFSNIFTLMSARGYKDFRVDTHELNTTMRHVFEREGFVRRGVVWIEGERIAYQKEL